MATNGKSKLGVDLGQAEFEYLLIQIENGLTWVWFKFIESKLSPIWIKIAQFSSILDWLDFVTQINYSNS